MNVSNSWGEDRETFDGVLRSFVEEFSQPDLEKV
jgi:hypothetical protein